MLPSSPLSHASCLSRASSFHGYDSYVLRLIKYLLSWIPWTAIVFLWMPIVIFQLTGLRKNGAQSNHSPSSDLLSGPRSTLKSPHIKDPTVQRTTDRRRGVIEVS